jgi:hypothetical protein
MAVKTEQRKIQIIADGTQVNASLSDMQKASRLLFAEMSKLPTNSEAFVKKSAEFQQVKKKLDETKGAATGASKSLKEMANEALMLSPFGGVITTITAAMGRANMVIKAVSASTHLFKIALASTGVGLLVIALGSLISYLTSTQTGIDKVNQVLTPLNVIFQKITGVVQNLGGNVFKGLGEMLNGNVLTGFKTIGKGAVQAGSEFKTAFTEGIKQGGELAAMNIKIEETETELTKSRAELNKKYQEGKEIAQDQTLSEVERLKAAQDAKDAQNELLAQEQGFLDLKMDRMKLEQTFNDTSRAGYQDLAQLEAERIDFEAMAAKKRSSAKSLENSISKEIHAENMKRSDETVKKENENQKRLDGLRKEYGKAASDLEKNLADVTIALMDEGLAKKEAKLNLDLTRELELLEQKRLAILANETLTEEERQAIRDKFAALDEMKRQENRIQLAELQEQEREEDLEKKLEQFDTDQEIETLLLENALIGAVDAEMRKKEALLGIQREYAAEKLALLEASGEGESVQALKLKNVIGQIDQDIAQNKIDEAQRAETYKIAVQQAGLDAARGFLQLGLEVLGENTKARKVAAVAMKAFEIGMVINSGITEIAGYYKSNAGIPIIGPGLAAALSIQAGIRTLAAVVRIKGTKYAEGGSTGSGRVIDMMMGATGSWTMPNGQSAKDVGSFAGGGHVGSASFGVIGEAGSEWVGPNWMMRSPKYANIFGYLEAERRRATPFAVGGVTASAPMQLPSTAGGTPDLQQMLSMIEQFGEMNLKLDAIASILEQWPSKLRVYNDPRDIMDGVRVLNEIEADSRINR